MKNVKSLMTYFLMAVAGAGGVIGFDSLNQEPLGAVPHGEIILLDTTDAKKQVADTWLYEFWVEYALQQKAEIKRENAFPVPDSIMVETYYVQHFYAALTHFPSITWIRQRVTPYREGAVAVRVLEQRRVKKLKPQTQ